LRPDNAVEPVHNQNKTRFTWQPWEAVVSIDHFQVFGKDCSHPWNTNPRCTRTGVVATWFLGENHPTLGLIVSSGENHPTLWLVRVKTTPLCG